MYFLHLVSWVNIMFVKGVMLLHIGIIDLFSLLYKIHYIKKNNFFIRSTNGHEACVLGLFLKIFLYIHVRLFLEEE